ncbi:MAG: VWA domain-containing protein [Clostridiales bacterium]|nr:VWA domain-containing protein [Clostridiales bacterium]
MLNAMSIQFDNGWLLFLLVPAIGLALIPYFRVPKQHRNTLNRVLSLSIHCVILLLAVLMLAGLSFTFTQVSVKKDVIILVDASDSTETTKEEMDEFIDSILSEVDSRHRVGIVTFGGDCVYSAEMSKDPKEVKKQYSEQKQTPVGDATDISSALLYARGLLSSPKDGRIILLSDGRQTDNNAVATVRALSSDGVRVDTVYFPSSGYAEEAQISDVEVQMSGSNADVIVTVESTVVQRATIQLYDGDELAAEHYESLGVGENVFSFIHSVLDSKVHVLRVVIAPERDTLEKNNEHYAYVCVNVSNKILLVDGSNSGASDLYGLLGDDYDVTKVTLSNLPSTVPALCEYGEIILMNVANADLPNGFDDMLTEYVEEHGGGLYTVGGDKAYMQNDMENTKFQELLPVNADTSAKTLGLLLMIDSSGSMNEIVSGTTPAKTRMELAIEAAVASVNELKATDYVGVISFNASANVVMEMSSLDRKDTIINRIRSIKTSTGTYYYKALELARNMMEGFSSTELKHIIFLTDGEPAGEGFGIDEFVGQVDRIARNNVTLSTIALGPSVPTDIVKAMAEHGGGRFEPVTQESKLIDVMIKETTTAAGQYLNEGEFRPTITAHAPAVSGITELPELGGFYGARIKEGATMILGYQGNPIYAEWSKGNGRVGSFMCDLEGAWSAKLFSDSSGVKFVMNSVASVISKKEITNQTVSVEFSKENRAVQAVIRAVLEDGESVTAKLISPSGSTSELKLGKLSAARFAAAFKMSEHGVYTVCVAKSGGGTQEEYYAYTSFSYSKEYDVFADDDECFSIMERISLEGNGSMLFPADKIFGGQSETTAETADPTMVLLIICAVLFLLDIVVRKFKIKLPSERREERRAKTSEADEN